MHRALLALLGIAVVHSVAAQSASPPANHVYWLSSDPRSEYEVLVISRRPITALAGAVDNAILIQTYARDSIWNTDRRPVKPLPRVTHLSADRIDLGGQSYHWTPARLEDAIRLLEAPEGTLPVHRLHRASDGQEALIKSLAARLRAGG